MPKESCKCSLEMEEQRKGRKEKTCRLAYLDKCNTKMGFDDDEDEFRDICTRREKRTNYVLSSKKIKD